MKAPANFDRQWMYTIRDEAHRVAREIINQVVLGRATPTFIKVPVDEDISVNMDNKDLDVFLSYFNCDGLYLTTLPGKRNYIVTVRSDLVTINIMSTIHKVKPVRLHRINHHVFVVSTKSERKLTL